MRAQEAALFEPIKRDVADAAEHGPSDRTANQEFRSGRGLKSFFKSRQEAVHDRRRNVIGMCGYRG